MIKPPLRRWTRKDAEEAGRLWQANVPAEQIGQRLGRSRCAVIGKLHRMGLLGMEPARKRVRDERIAKRYSDGARADELAMVYGLSASRVTAIARLYDVRRGAGRPPIRKKPPMPQQRQAQRT